MTTSPVKLALKRDWNVPIGQPAQMHLDCFCGTPVPIADPFTTAIVTCPTCRTTYDSFGWIMDAHGDSTR